MCNVLVPCLMQAKSSGVVTSGAQNVLISKLKLNCEGVGSETYLPEAEEDNPFDAQELGKRLVRFQLLCKHMVKGHERIQSQGNRNIENDSECPAHPTWVQPKKLKCDHQNRTHWPDDNKLPGPEFEELQCLVVETNGVWLQFVETHVKYISVIYQANNFSDKC